MGTWGAKSPKPSLALGTWLVPEIGTGVWISTQKKIRMSTHRMLSDISFNFETCHHRPCWVLGFRSFEGRSPSRLDWSWSSPRRASRFGIGAPAVANGGCPWLRSAFLCMCNLSCCHSWKTLLVRSAHGNKAVYDIEYACLVENKAWRPKVEGDPRVSAAICKEGFQAPPETQSCWN